MSIKVLRKTGIVGVAIDIKVKLDGKEITKIAKRN